MDKALERHVGTLWCHTPKAIERGHPSDRIFAVAAVGPADDGSPGWRTSKWLHAWKCTLMPDGRLEHPAFDTPMDADDPDVFNKTSANGAEPSAVFRPDSLYQPYQPPNPNQRAGEALCRRLRDALWRRQRDFLETITGDDVRLIEKMLREQSLAQSKSLVTPPRDDIVTRLNNPRSACLVDRTTMEAAAVEIIKLRRALAAALAEENE